VSCYNTAVPLHGLWHHLVFLGPGLGEARHVSRGQLVEEEPSMIALVWYRMRGVDKQVRQLGPILCERHAHQIAYERVAPSGECAPSSTWHGGYGQIVTCEAAPAEGRAREVRE
jgi:hypothetical protein